MPRSTITSKGQITLPKEVRNRLAITAGDQIEFTIEEDGTITVMSVKKSAMRLHGVISSDVDGPLSIEEMDQAIADQMFADDDRIRGGKP